MYTILNNNINVRRRCGNEKKFKRRFIYVFNFETIYRVPARSSVHHINSQNYVTGREKKLFFSLFIYFLFRET